MRGLNLDMKAAADEYKWQIILERSKRQPNKRGRPKILPEVYREELRITEETVNRMETSLK